MLHSILIEYFLGGLIMVNRRVTLSFVLVLFLSSSLSFSESAWQNWREWSQQFLKIEQDAFKKIMPFIGVGFATVGGFYYWINKKINDMFNKPLEESDYGALHLFPLYTGKKKRSSIKQLDVYSQFNRDGGGGASCGYHSLLHSMQVVNALGTNQDTSVLNKSLMDSEQIQEYFGEKGSWRKDIIEKRKREEFKKELHEKLVRSLTKNENTKAVELYKSALGFIEDRIIFALSQSTNSLDFTDENIQGYISEALLKLKNEDNASIIDELRQNKVIDANFNYDTMRTSVLSKDGVIEPGALWNAILDDQKFESDFKGEWLSDGEVEYIWKHHKKDILKEDIFSEDVCKFKAIANFGSIGREGFDEVTPYIKENIKPHLGQEKQLFGIFALGTMRQTGETEGTRGHWYPLVMHQNREGVRHYYIMDSANNRDRTGDKNALKVISLIED